MDSGGTFCRSRAIDSRRTLQDQEKAPACGSASDRGKANPFAIRTDSYTRAGRRSASGIGPIDACASARVSREVAESLTKVPTAGHAKRLSVLFRCSLSQAVEATAPTTLYAASGRLIPFNSNSPTGSTFTASSTAISTRGLMRI
jgi:hypothetical protein